MSEIDWKHLCDLSSQENAALRAALEKAQEEMAAQLDSHDAWGELWTGKLDAAIAERDSARALLREKAQGAEEERDELLGKASAFESRLAFSNRHAGAAEDLLRQAVAERDSARSLLREAMPRLPQWEASLRARIAKELGKP